jgi:hypothetical protein
VLLGPAVLDKFILGGCPVWGGWSEKGVEMSTKPITPRLANGLRLLAASQLQIQAARSVALDNSALGVMTVDAAVATIILDATGAYDLWILALALLGLSFALAVRATRLPGAKETGPLIDDILDASETAEADDELERSLLRDLATDMRTNQRALARKRPLLDRAQTFLVAAILVELLGRVVQ